MPSASGHHRILPFIRDLNPQTDDFPGLLAVIKKHQGKRAAMARAIKTKWQKDKRRTGFTLHSIEANTLSSLGPENLGVLDENVRLTVLGRELHAARKRDAEFKQILARHLVVNRGGWQFVHALRRLWGRGSRPTRQEISQYMAEKYGIAEWRDLNNLSQLHKFLEYCGIVSRYRVDEAAFESLLGASTEDLAQLQRFTLETRASLVALVRLGGSATSGAIREAAESSLRRPMDVHQFPTRMQPLIDAGMVEFEGGSRGDLGRKYSVTDAKKVELLSSIAADLAVLGVVPDEVFEHDLRWVVDRVSDASLSNDERARALETLAAMICWRLGLRHILVRHRSPFEVDVQAEYLGTGYQIWSAQCKAFTNQQITSEHILREFGIAVLSRYSVLLFVTTTDFSNDAIVTANRITRETAIQIVRINGSDLREIARDEEALFRIVAAQSASAKRLRGGDPPSLMFTELDAAQDWVFSDKPTLDEVWLYLERRDVVVDRSLVRPLLAVWLDSKRETEGFDPRYLERVRAGS